MKEDKLVHTALENLYNHTGITGKWKENGVREMDGKITFKINKQQLTFNAHTKQELRNHQLAGILEKAKLFDPLIVVAGRLFPKIKEALRNKQVAYLEANGNIFLHQQDTMVWIDAQQPLKAKKETGNRAFTKTGLKVLFHFLLHEDDINLPYREIAGRTGAALGNINNIINGLRETGFVINLNKDQYKLTNKKNLLDRWITGYAEQLKPGMHIGNFRFVKEEDFLNWKALPIANGKTFWGGEAAGSLLTNYLKPAELTLYTGEARNELIKNYRLVPDENGNVKVFKKFWHNETTGNVVPPLLAYADLTINGDRRSLETAQKIYNEFLQDKF
ncbi:MAG TPA: type IV toxin-antitoxin system AbiEi family antitoxin [Parafilimonas sp.]|nr:type IV toxin-antitoxin system AbiEi family antitoxin [Parafilimonas sp.]